MKLGTLSASTFLLQCTLAFGQAEEEKEQAISPPDVSQAYKPLVLETKDKKTGFVRFINWNQFVCTAAKNEEGSLSVKPQLHRIRFLAYASFFDKISVVMHFGVNNLTAEGLHPTGQSPETQLFLHDAWSEFKVAGKALSIGAGLHYYNGLSRITNASTLNFMTYDNYRQAWAQVGLSDQFARHLGAFAKGRLGKLNYHFSVNDPITETFDLNGYNGEPGSIAYVGKAYFPDRASMTVQGYADYQFLEQESNALPYRMGSYHGSKKIFNVGAGFFSHPNGVVSVSEDSTAATHDVRHFALDVFYDSPLSIGGAITAYAVYYHFDYGPQYDLNRVYGTGNSAYFQVGYLLPGKKRFVQLQPYISASYRNYERYDGVSNTGNAGINLLFMGHHSKITMEYQSALPNYDQEKPARNNRFIVQAMLYL